MRIVAVLNQKGGVGKTTTAVNLGAALALRGRRVLLVDADPQGNLSDHLGVDPAGAERSVYDVLTDDLAVADAMQQTETERLFLVPSHPDLAAAEQELAGEIGRELRLRRALAQLPDEAFDWVFIDCPPSLGLLSLNAMASASELIITVQTEYFAMRGLGQLDQIVQMVREHVNPDLRILGILATLVNPVTKLAKEVIAEVSAHYGDLVFRTRIRQNVRLAEAPGYQNHIFAYEPLSAGAEDYAALADEIEAQVLQRAAPDDTAAAEPSSHENEPQAPPKAAAQPPVPETPPRPDPSPRQDPGPQPGIDDVPPPESRAASSPPPGMLRADQPRAYDVTRSGRIIMPPPRMPLG